MSLFRQLPVIGLQAGVPIIVETRAKEQSHANL